MSYAPQASAGTVVAPTPRDPRWPTIMTTVTAMLGLIGVLGRGQHRTRPPNRRQPTAGHSRTTTAWSR